MSKAVIEALKKRFSGAVLATETGPGGDEVAFIEKGLLLHVCRWLKEEPAMAFNVAPYVTAVDYLGQVPRFEVVYNLVSTVHGHRLRLRVKLTEEDPVVDSLTSVWRGVDWFERYCFDMYGIRFTGHPDLRRLLMYDEFVGHPLRKDYPLRGRQPLVPEREIDERFRGPGPAGRD